MGRAKEIIVKVIPQKVAVAFVKSNHYSGKVDPRSNLHFGCFLDGKLHGVLQYGISVDKNKVIGLVEGTKWNEFIELNRMAFDECLPKYSESRCIAISIKLIKKHAPHVKWILSYADGSQCGDGTIYRASGFLLTQIGINKSMYKMPNGDVICKIILEPSFGSNGTNSAKHRYGKTGEFSTWSSSRFLNHIGAVPIIGFQLRYIYLIDRTCKITVPILPFSKIDEMGAGMYKGEKISIAERQHAALAHKGEQPAIQPVGAFDSTMPLKTD
jgi:hypothetical protein